MTQDYRALTATFLASLEGERRMSPYTVRNYTAALDQFGGFLTAHLGYSPDGAALNALKTRDFRAFLAARHREGLDPATIRLELSALRSFYRFWDKRGVLSSAALSALKSPKRRAVLPRPISRDGAQDLLAAAVTPKTGEPAWVSLRDRALFTLLYGAGLRISEALALPYTTAEGPLRVDGKGGKTRVVPLLEPVVAALRQYKRALQDALPPGTTFNAETPLFLGVRGQRLSPSVAQARMRTLRKTLGLPDSATPHALRHAFATELLASGADLRVIQELLGHASLASTQRYTAIDPDRLTVEHRRCHPRAARHQRS